MTIHIQSKIGGRTENQDFYGTAKTQFGELIIVCDGMGGHKGGRHAAEKAVKTIIQYFEKPNNTNSAQTLKKAIENANTEIWNQAKNSILLKGMGTTVVALLVTPNEAICAHVGDSRIYQLRDGQILHRTFDHSHVFELVRAGMLTEEEARVSSKSNIITRALGIQPTVEIEITEKLSYKKGDRFLLCTDGICGAVPENELVEMASQKADIESIVSELVEKIDTIGQAKGGMHDNLTAALIEIEDSNSAEVVTKKESTQKKVKGKRFIIPTILVLLAFSLALNFYLLSKVKMSKKPIINIQSIIPDSIAKPDSTTLKDTII